MKLNGWQRLGVIASAIWLPVGLLTGSGWWVSERTRVDRTGLRICLTGPDWKRCYADFDAGYAAHAAGNWWFAAAFVAVTLALAWGLSWAIAKLWRWVAAGGFR
jgi:hypothetical protein